MIVIASHCATCGQAFIPAAEDYVRGTWRQCVACRGHPKVVDANTTTSAHHEAPTASHDESRKQT